LLVKAGFYHIHLDAILYGGSTSYSNSSGRDSDMHYNVKMWGGEKMRIPYDHTCVLQ